MRPASDRSHASMYDQMQLPVVAQYRDKGRPYRHQPGAFDVIGAAAFKVIIYDVDLATCPEY